MRLIATSQDGVPLIHPTGLSIYRVPTDEFRARVVFATGRTSGWMDGAAARSLASRFGGEVRYASPLRDLISRLARRISRNLSNIAARRRAGQA